jgi:hypothetical protein
MQEKRVGSARFFEAMPSYSFWRVLSLLYLCNAGLGGCITATPDKQFAEGCDGRSLGHNR